VPLGGAGLASLARFDTRLAVERLRGCELSCLCDVDTRLTGPDGARLYAAQKGANAASEAVLARGLEQLADVLSAHAGRDVRALDSGGAAGGIAASLSALLGARLLPGIDFLLDMVGFERQLSGAELVITAEGRLDRQSAFNKGPLGVARRARAVGVPTLVLAGSIAADLALETTPFASALAIGREALALGEAQPHAAEWLAATSEHALRLYLLARDASRRP
jgi:glycerate kinase